jgi:hypothetical protein
MRRGGLAVAVTLGVVTPSFAQPRPVGLPGGIEVSIGGGVFGGTAAVARDASLRANTPLGSASALFSTSTRFAPAPLVEARVGVAVTPRYILEAHVAATRPSLETTVESDAEGAPSLSAVERIEQFVVGAGLVVGLDGWRVGSWVPVVEVGAGYLRQLHEGRTLVEDGQVYYVGGGVRRGLLARARGVVRAIGVRADARCSLLSGGVAVTQGLQPRLSVTGGVFVVF